MEMLESYSVDPATTQIHWDVKRMFRRMQRLLESKAKAGELMIHMTNSSWMPMVQDQEVAQSAAATKGELVPPTTADTPDQPRVRAWCRQDTGF